jgi:hypothetical protein
LIVLERFIYSERGTFGLMTLPDGWQCYTVERPWRGNVPRESCIPEGIYGLIRGRYNAGGYDTFELVNVPGRSLIKIHKANLPEDLEGCIALGKTIGFLGGKMAILSSGEAFADWMLHMRDLPADAIKIQCMCVTST